MKVTETSKSFIATLGLLLLVALLPIVWLGNVLPKHATVADRLAEFRGEPKLKSLDFIEDFLCPSCRHAFATPEIRCGAKLPRPDAFSATDHQSLIQAGVDIATAHPNTCRACNPASCRPADKRFWRYDRVGPTVQHDTLTQLNSVPKQHRLPATAVDNITAFLLASKQHVYPAREYFFDYNPSIVQLPAMVQQQFFRDSHPRAVYLASFRVSNQHYCLHPTDRKLMNGATQNGAMNSKPPPAKNWLGLALLDKNFNILTDTVLDVRHVGFAAAEDFRLFRLNDQIYISSFDVVAPLFWEPNDQERLAIPTVFDDDTFGTVYIRRFVSCASCSKKNRGYCGKNFNYFVASTTQAYTEIWPSPPHMVRTINLSTPCHRSDEPEQFMGPNKAPEPSFATVEQVYFPHLGPHESILTRGRGGACCIEMRVGGQALLVGIQHVKTPSQRNRRLVQNLTSNHYLSQLYAFESNPPFSIVAQSGYFCLGFGNTTEPLVRLTNWRKFWLGQEFDCPRIHFVSGMTLAANDPSQAILAYGINDCLSRFVRVQVSDLRKLLLESPA